MRIIVVPETKEQIEKYYNDINYKLSGKQIELEEKKFKLFWQSGIVDEFYRKTGKFIDDYETTIINDENDILIFKGIVEKASFNVFNSSLKHELLSLVIYAYERRSGIIFFF